MNKNVQGHIFALTANILWGLMAPIGKSALMEFSALSVTTFRMVGAAACFWLLSAFCKYEHVDHRDMLKIFFASLFALVFNQGVYIFGLSMTSPIDASIVTTTLPIVTMIIAAIYLKEPITNLKVLGIFVGAMGALTLILSSQTAGSGEYVQLYATHRSFYRCHYHGLGSIRLGKGNSYCLSIPRRIYCDEE